MPIFKEYGAFNFLINTTVLIYGMYRMRYKQHTERDIRQTEHFSPILRANRPKLRCDSGNLLNITFYISCRMPPLGGDSPYWSPLLIPYDRRMFRGAIQ